MTKRVNFKYFIGVQLDGNDREEPLRNRLSEQTEQQSAKLVKATAENVDEAVREHLDANSVRDQKICGQSTLNPPSQSLTKKESDSSKSYSNGG